MTGNQDELACGEPLCATVLPHHVHSDEDGRSWCCGPYPYTPAAAPTSTGGEASGCGHPNHGESDHDCRPFLPPSPSVDREAGQRRIAPAQSGDVLDDLWRGASPSVGQGEPLHEFQCPACGATTRARMADAPSVGQDTGQLRDEGPKAVDEALRALADWLDEADRLIDRLAAARGITRRNSGDDMQRDMRRLADWFSAHPTAAGDAWAHVRRALGDGS